MTRRMIPLPAEGRRADIARLMAQREALAAAHKNTAIIDRKLKLARAHQLRREQKERKAS